MAKKDHQPKSSLTASDVAALELTGLPYGEPEVKSVRDALKEKAARANKGGQFYELMDDSVWSTDPDEQDMRLFAALRLIVEYDGPAGKQVHNKAGRRRDLLKLVEKIATARHNQKALNSLPVLQKAGEKNVPSALDD